MQTRVIELKEALLHWIFPHTCSGCGSDQLNRHTCLCMRCLKTLPETGYENMPFNPVEKIFWGRLPLQQAAAHCYFTRASLVQRLMHQLKYKGNRELGLQLGKLMGEALLHSGRFLVDAVVPLPLFASREKRRGYNQATVLSEGIAETLGVPLWQNIITRSHHTHTQTHKSRLERWQNIEGKFQLQQPEIIQHKHILLIDDVVTTGATLEACGRELLSTGTTQLSIGALCYALAR